MSAKQGFINFIDKEVTSGRCSGLMVDRLSTVPFPEGFDREDKTKKRVWDNAMKHCMIWCERMDEFNSGAKLKRVFKS